MRALLFALLGVWIYFLVQRVTDKAPIQQYNGAGFCGMDGKTYKNQQDVVGKIAHQGPCGFCSNAHDFNVYNQTRVTMTRTATICATAYLLFGDAVSRYCMSYFTNLTNDCTNCWMENIACTAGHCLGTCLRHVADSIIKGNAFGYLSTGNKNELSPCFLCDETKCGPGFKKCSGLTRRNAGFVTDIDRKQEEIWTGK